MKLVNNVGISREVSWIMSLFLHVNPFLCDFHFLYGIKFLVFIFREDFFTISKNAKFKTREIKSQ